jgi:hypothetical protein
MYDPSGRAPWAKLYLICSWKVIEESFKIQLSKIIFRESKASPQAQKYVVPL